MEKNRLYVIIFILLFILVVLLGTFNLFSSRQKNSESSIVVLNPVTPTTNLVFPKKSIYSPAPTNLVPTMTTFPTKSITILDLAYPLKYESLILDYIPPQNQIIILYPKDKQQAETVFKRFLDQYKTTDQELSGIKVDYIGLIRDPSEPIPGSLLQ